MEREAARIERDAERIERDAERLGREIERTVAHSMRVHTAAVNRSGEAQADARNFLLSCAGAGSAGGQDEDELAAGCETRMLATAREALASARSSIAANSAMPAEIRRDVLRELDREIAEMNRPS
jgi:hypothetical protein